MGINCLVTAGGEWIMTGTCVPCGDWQTTGALDLGGVLVPLLFGVV